MPSDRPTWREHLRSLAAACPDVHPYTLAIRLEVDGYRNITGKQVADALREQRQQET